MQHPSSTSVSLLSVGPSCEKLGQYHSLLDGHSKDHGTFHWASAPPGVEVFGVGLVQLEAQGAGLDMSNMENSLTIT